MRRSVEPEAPRWMAWWFGLAFLAWLPLTIERLLGFDGTSGIGVMIGAAMFVGPPIVVAAASAVEGIAGLVRPRGGRTDRP